jgi:hypothetical protein
VPYPYHVPQELLVRLIDIQEPKRDSGVSGRVTRVVSNTERHLLGLECERLVDGLFTGVSVQNHIDFGGPRLWPRPTEVLGKYGASGNATWTREFPGRVRP